MKFDDLDRKMRVFETAHDHCVLPGIFVIVRLDGRNFTRLTKEIYQFQAPFDVKFRDYMIETVKHLMDCGFRVVYGYTESDEISLLLHPKEDSFHRKERKINSILAGEASAKFSLLIGGLAAFDSRVCQIPTIDLLVDYFRWRNEDAYRNALNSHCYWALRNEGVSAQDAQKKLSGVSVADKNEMLFQKGINFNELPNWQKRGIGLFWESYEKQGVNPRTGQTVMAKRSRIHVELDLPMKDSYSEFIRKKIPGMGF